MLVRADGSIEGSIGGGALEEAVRERARAVLATGLAEVINSLASANFLASCSFSTCFSRISRR